MKTVEGLSWGEQHKMRLSRSQEKGVSLNQDFFFILPVFTKQISGASCLGAAEAKGRKRP